MTNTIENAETSSAVNAAETERQQTIEEIVGTKDLGQDPVETANRKIYH